MEEEKEKEEGRRRYRGRWHQACKLCPAAVAREDEGIKIVPFWTSSPASLTTPATAVAAMPADHEHITPLTTATADRPISDEEDCSTTTPTPPSSRRHHHHLIYCGSCISLIIVIAIVLVVIALTIYKVKKPVMTINPSPSRTST